MGDSALTPRAGRPFSRLSALASASISSTRVATLSRRRSCHPLHQTELAARGSGRGQTWLLESVRGSRLGLRAAILLTRDVECDGSFVAVLVEPSPDDVIESVGFTSLVVLDSVKSPQVITSYGSLNLPTFLLFRLRHRTDDYATGRPAVSRSSPELTKTSRFG